MATPEIDEKFLIKILKPGIIALADAFNFVSWRETQDSLVFEQKNSRLEISKLSILEGYEDNYNFHEWLNETFKAASENTNGDT